jgi:hypothetical protein
MRLVDLIRELLQAHSLKALNNAQSKGIVYIIMIALEALCIYSRITNKISKQRGPKIGSIIRKLDTSRCTVVENNFL